ncbi:23S rRNA pseudouridine1911/1915/1917 synthase [Tissierella praeacuta DSM 18095]|uniref:Pseudouridine synthase n=1 Tax=Tissierella praeacuta DSM 18095 TaxID=1123404 RepID=A0A1M4S5H4_9FIRM|nr:RluA family pseudouridine synthase [Tissierella praeacuta]SHE27464.1 23S rRNA pseudouridine1911/1915/1917 synthase [Tissierella praeacuta DSM 18095]SUP00897.1 Ribosomal large subunit pseudouridine synthase D [Tissierella praeacuta]
MNLFEESENIVVFEVQEDRLDLEDFLSSKDISGRLFRKLYKAKQIYVDGKFKRKGLTLEKGAVVSIYMEDESENTKPEKMDINIVYEDFDFLILNKQPNIVVHPTKSHQENTLSNGISYYFKEKGIKKKIRFVNRLDMDTTGILIVAKNPFAHQQMALQFESHKVEKKYQAIVDGIVEKDENYINLPIGREEDKSIRKTVTEEGQDALTKYTVIERYKDATLLDVQIFTGRSHQIRVHLDHIGHPIIGDSLYNKESPYINRQALHSYYLKVKHPRTKEDIEFIAPLPKDMENLINHLKNK